MSCDPGPLCAVHVSMERSLIASRRLLDLRPRLKCEGVRFLDRGK
jgi:hypothetical protein